ncbi:hypothetical protein CBER1_10577 [Cercospora berteroae]|uniref:Uncharacterized protein n=1 Tax=Cercospora berteroae TaxID=357750 RepID=A0A2S6BY75_9PEZI|nr:hypothetical protein CBER1_10577 [Cercospora berteroae]
MTRHTQVQVMRSPYSLANLPSGIISSATDPQHHVAIAVGEYVLDLYQFSLNDGFSGCPEVANSLHVFRADKLNAFAALGRPAHRATRAYLQQVLSINTLFPSVLQTNEKLQKACIFHAREVKNHLPIHIPSFTDFYGGMNHAVNAGSLFRSRQDAVDPNYHHLPEAYHSWASSIVVSRTSIYRPSGQVVRDVMSKDAVPALVASTRMDFKLEIGATLCRGNSMGHPVKISEVEEAIFGFVMLNDWLARDIQRWEYAPLGPFNGKNFGTSISAWVVLADALEPFRCKGLEGKAKLLPYLQGREDFTYDLNLEVEIKTNEGHTITVCKGNAAQGLVYSFEQMLAHHTVTGCPMEVGDILGSGTISGFEEGTLGCLLEITQNGQVPIELSNGTQRSWLQDGDTVTLKAFAGSDGGLVGFGPCAAHIFATSLIIHVTKFDEPERYTYLEGFGNYHQSEALPQTLPLGQNTPQVPACGLYTERISGSSVSAPKAQNQQTWLYRIMPTACHDPFTAKPTSEPSQAEILKSLLYTPSQLRWSPFELDQTSDWTDSLRLVVGTGNIAEKSGMSVFVYTVGESMVHHKSNASADGDILLIAQQSVLDIRTELGYLLVRPGEIGMIPRGIRYHVALPNGPARGYAVELHEGHWHLPERGPIGSHGLANDRDSQIPTASFEHNVSSTFEIVTKFNGKLFETHQTHSPFDVVGWHGSYYPWKYDLGRFITIGSISVDHPDPSIFSLLSAPGEVTGGSPVAEIAIFPPRWLVMEGTFRPPWYHRNTMGELMGLIKGEYDAKVDGGFRLGGLSLHNIMVGHGPDSKSLERGSTEALTPTKVGYGSLAFVIESNRIFGVSPWAMNASGKRQQDYNQKTWLDIKPRFVAPDSG